MRGIGQIGVEPEDVAEARAEFGERGGEVAEDLLGLRRDVVAPDEPAGTIEGNLSRDEGEAVGNRDVRVARRLVQRAGLDVLDGHADFAPVKAWRRAHGRARRA